MDRFANFGERFWRVTSIISGLIMTGYMLLIIVNIIMRKIGGRPIFGIIELICYASLTACCLALAQTEWKNGNIVMTLILESVNIKKRAILEVISSAICFVAFAYVFVQCIFNAVTKFETGGGTTDLHIPLYVITLFLAFGFIMLDICLLMKLILKTGIAVKLFRGKV